MPGIHHHSYLPDVRFEVQPSRSWPTESAHAHHTLFISTGDPADIESATLTLNLRHQDLFDLSAVLQLALGELEDQLAVLREAVADNAGDIP